MHKTMIRRSSTPLALVLALLLVAACSSDTDKPDYVERPVSAIYNEAMDSLNEGLYAEAAIKFDEVERQHPYSSWATKAQLMAAYAHYETNAYDEAHRRPRPVHRTAPVQPRHALRYYLKGLSYYEQISDIARDQRMTKRALATFRELINRYPNSRYARDAKIKLDLTNDHLAGKDMEIGRFLLAPGHSLAAINRFKAVIEHYQTTTHVPEALHRLTEAYLSLGIIDEARKMAAVLGHNFPGSEWYVDSYQLIEGKQIRPADEDPWYKVW